ncbi:hypothetical protein [Streptomyces pactum]|uniref:hypothetical protein n=1 Tax=Streptomyces pactum TaxID=68249 RepID=UPI003701255B
MTACAIEPATEPDHDAAHPARPPLPAAPPPYLASPALTIAAGGTYAARLACCAVTGGRYPERWTLSGPEPYAVPLHGTQPEEPDTEVLPLADGQVLVRRRVAGHHRLSLLHPAALGTVERPLGDIHRAEVSLLPPAPAGAVAFALSPSPGGAATELWLVYGDGVPRPLTVVPGRCTGGVWLDRTGGLLALDRELDGRTKTVALDLRHGGAPIPLLQITEESEDRLLLADPDSGLLLLRSDAPGTPRLGWGMLGSPLPVRFPECLREEPGTALVPFAVQPGRPRSPEGCAVAFRTAGEGPWAGPRPDRPAPAPDPVPPGAHRAPASAGPPVGGAEQVALWRPGERRLRRITAPAGWLADAGFWTARGELWLPYATPADPCGLRRVCSGAAGPERHRTAPGTAAAGTTVPGATAPGVTGTAAPGSVPAGRPAAPAEGGGKSGEGVGAPHPVTAGSHPAAAGPGDPSGPGGPGDPSGPGGPGGPGGSAGRRSAPLPAEAGSAGFGAAGRRTRPGTAARPVPLQQAPLAREPGVADWFEDPPIG